MPGPPDVSGKPKANNVYAQKVVVKQAVRSHVADQLQDAQKQRLLPSDSPRSPSSQRAQHAQTPTSYSPRQQAQQPPQQRQPQSPRQASDQSDDDWTWPQQATPNASQQAAKVALQSPAVAQLAEGGSPNGSPRPRSASLADRASPGPQDSEGSQQSTTPSRPRTGSASPRITSDALASIRAKNVSWQDAQGENLCQYREFEPSDVADSDDDDTTWHAQKKGCCVVM